MAGSKVSDYGIGDSNIQSVMLTLDKTFKGFHQVSLTNYDSTDESEIAAGSVVEVNGAQYKFESNEAITGSPSDGTVYIQLIPDGDSITAAYTNTAPTWSDSKQGWYGTTTAANYRYLEFVMTKSSTTWNYKNNLYNDNKQSLNSFGLFGRSSNFTVTENGSTTILYDVSSANQHISISSGIITVTQSGLYNITLNPVRDGTYTGGTRYDNLIITSSQFTDTIAQSYKFYHSDYTTTISPNAMNVTCFLKTDDTLRHDAVFAGSSSISYSYTDKSYFAVKKISGDLKGFI